MHYTSISPHDKNQNETLLRICQEQETLHVDRYKIDIIFTHTGAQEIVLAELSVTCPLKKYKK